MLINLSKLWYVFESDSAFMNNIYFEERFHQMILFVKSYTNIMIKYAERFLIKIQLTQTYYKIKMVYTFSFDMINEYIDLFFN